MNPFINIAVTAAHAGGDLIMRYLNRVDQLKISAKGNSDFVSEVDRGAEAEIIRNIQRYYPQHAILGEESGPQGESDWTWIIDPLDGTTNFLHGINHFAVSIAAVHKGQIEHGVIYCPPTQELYVASRGGGAVRNNRRIRCSKRRTMEEALIGTGAPIRNPERNQRYLPIFESVISETAGIRRAGSAALDLAYVADGRLDGFWELNLKPWDIAAGILLVQEAGGIVTEIDGGDPLKTGSVVAGNPKIHPLLEAMTK